MMALSPQASESLRKQTQEQPCVSSCIRVWHLACRRSSGGGGSGCGASSGGGASSSAAAAAGGGSRLGGGGSFAAPVCASSGNCPHRALLSPWYQMASLNVNPRSGAICSLNLSARFHPQYFLTRTGVT